jgi:hypothetical protein
MKSTDHETELIHSTLKGSDLISRLQRECDFVICDPWTLSTAIQFHTCGVRRFHRALDPWTLSTANKLHTGGVRRIPRDLTPWALPTAIKFHAFGVKTQSLSLGGSDMCCCHA